MIVITELDCIIIIYLYIWKLTFIFLSFKISGLQNLARELLLEFK